MLECLWTWALVTGLTLLVTYIIGTWTYDHFSKQNIPSLKPIPFLGNMAPLLFWTLSFPDYVSDIYNRLKGHKYGGLYQLMDPILLIRDPEVIKIVTVRDFEHFLDHQVAISEDAEPLFGKMLFNLQEGNILAVEMKDLFTRYTNDVIATSAFGIECDSLSNPKNEFYEMGRDVTNFGGLRTLIFFGYALSPKLMKLLHIKLISSSAVNFFRSLVHNTMSVREERGIVRPDMIHLLMQAKKGTLQADDNVTTTGKTIKPKWDDDDLAAQVVVFFLAGFDTASTLLCFAAHLLATHPDVQSRLQEEIDMTLNKDGGNLTYEAVHGMKYLDMVVSETLRMYPPNVMTDRMCVKSYTLPTEPRFTLKPGDVVWVPIYALHHDPDYFPDPEKFDPERFSDENRGNIKNCTYLPFGSGPRNCIGSRFALMESKVALVQLLSRFNLRVVSKTPIPIQITKKGFNMTVDGGFWLGLEQRVKV